MIGAILSDLGNVLLRFDNTLFFRALGRLTGRPEEEVRRVAHDNLDLVTLFERGAITPQDFHRNACDLLGADPGFEAFYGAYGDVFALNPAVLELYRRLRPKHRMALVSSTDVMRWSFIKRRFPEILFFDHYILSFDVEAAKPDPRVYREALRLLDCRPEAAVFIDDLPENVAGAEKMGVRGILYNPGIDLEAELARLGVTAAPRPS